MKLFDCKTIRLWENPHTPSINRQRPPHCHVNEYPLINKKTKENPK